MAGKIGLDLESDESLNKPQPSVAIAVHSCRRAGLSPLLLLLWLPTVVAVNAKCGCRIAPL
jgi:hypothetical protein